MHIKINPRIFNKVYQPYLKREERYQVYYGGAGSGKSKFVAQKLIIKLLQNPNHKLLVVRKTFNTHLESTFAELLQVLDDFKIRDRCNVIKSPMSITLPNGARIIFKGTDEETKLLSISGVTMVWIEEAFEIEKEIFEQIILRLRGGNIKSQFFLTFNPINESHWLKSYFFDNEVDDCFVLKTTYLDNRFLDKEYINSLNLMKKTNPDKYKVYALGEWGTLGKTIFDKNIHWRVEDFDYEDVAHHKMIVGMDFGFTNDPTSLVQSFVDEANKIIYIQDGFYQRGMLSSDIHGKLEQMQLLKVELLADSASPMTIAELKKLGVRRIRGAKKGAGSILAGIDVLKTYTIIVHPRLDWMINELENYQYKKDKSTGKYLNEVQANQKDHAIDALRYSIQLIGSDNRLRLMSKSSFGF